MKTCTIIIAMLSLLLELYHVRASVDGVGNDDDSDTYKYSIQFIGEDQLPSGTYRTNSTPVFELEVMPIQGGQGGILRILKDDGKTNGPPQQPGLLAELSRSRLRKECNVQECFYFPQRTQGTKSILEHIGAGKSQVIRSHYNVHICKTNKGLELNLLTRRNQHREIEDWERRLPLEKVEGGKSIAIIQEAASNPTRRTTTRKRKRKMSSPVLEKNAKEERESPTYSKTPSTTPTGTSNKPILPATSTGTSNKPILPATPTDALNQPLPDGRYASPEYSPDKIEVHIDRDNIGQRLVDLFILPYGGQKESIPGAGAIKLGTVLHFSPKPGEVREIFGRQLKLENLEITSNTQGGLELSFPIANSREKFPVDLHRIK